MMKDLELKSNPALPVQKQRRNKRIQAKQKSETLFFLKRKTGTLFFGNETKQNGTEKIQKRNKTERK
jgi:hypothetical protein